MEKKPPYEQLEQRVKELEKEAIKRKRAEEALRESEEKYRIITETSIDGIYQIDNSGKFIFLNEAVAEIGGYKREEVLGMHFSNFISETDLPKAMKLFEKLNSGESLESELVCKHKLGHEFRIYFSAVPVTKQDKIVGLTGIMRDITERKKAEETIRLFSDAVAGAIDAIAVVDIKGTITYVNPALEELYGYEKGELLGEPVSVLNPDSEMVRQQISTLMKTGNWGGEVLQQKKNKETFPAHLSLSTVRDGKGNPIAMMGAVRDITGRKEAEEALRERGAELEIKTKSLEEVNTALRVLLEKKDDDKKELEEKVLSNVNELVAPFLEKLKKSRLDSKQLAYVQILESNLNNIISPFSRTLSAKYLSLTPTEIQVADLVKAGKTSQETAEVMNLCSRTVESHRDSIRKKLGLKKKKVNLRSYLLSI